MGSRQMKQAGEMGRGGWLAGWLGEEVECRARQPLGKVGQSVSPRHSPCPLAQEGEDKECQLPGDRGWSRGSLLAGEGGMPAA